MSKKLIEQVEKYFDEESKKYSMQLHDNSILGFDSDKMKELLDNKVKNYYAVFQLRMINYCYAISKKENMDLNNTDIDKMLEYYEEYYEYKKEEEDLKVIAKNIKIDITKINDIAYLLNEVEMQSKKLMKTHNDSVDYLTIIYLLKI